MLWHREHAIRIVTEPMQEKNDFHRPGTTIVGFGESTQL